MKPRHSILWLLSFLFISACDLEQEIDIELPYHEPQLVVECYLTPGKNFTATVLESSGYFDAPGLPLVPDAEVFITNAKGTRITLGYKPNIKEGEQFYTHSSTSKMKGNPGDIYKLEVVDGKGRKVTAFTTILPVVPIQEITWKFNEKNKAYLITSFQDNPAVANFYRYMSFRESKNRSSENRDFAATDKLTNGEKTSYGSAYDYDQGDTLVVTLYNIEKQYYDFLNSTEDAKRANKNPFSQPSRVRSSVEGGIGIFTNLAFQRRKVVLVK